jgi:Tfp pilus assembly protein PilN
VSATLRPLNLATRPFRNERLPNLAVGLLTLATVTLTVVHGVTLARLLPSHLRQTETEALALETEAGRLRAERDQLRRLQPEKVDLVRWNTVRDLVDRRLFRWTQLFTRLGQIVPEGVTLTTIEPAMQADAAEVRLSATCAAGGTKPLLDLVRKLEQQPDFDSAVPESIAKADKGHTIVLHVRYRPVDEHETPVPAVTSEQAR